MEFLGTVFTWIMGHGRELLEIVGAFAIVAQFTPNKTDDRIVQFVLDAVNSIGMNNGRARNVD